MRLYRVREQNVRNGHICFGDNLLHDNTVPNPGSRTPDKIGHVWSEITELSRLIRDTAMPDFDTAAAAAAKTTETTSNYNENLCSNNCARHVCDFGPEEVGDEDEQLVVNEGHHVEYIIELPSYFRNTLDL